MLTAASQLTQRTLCCLCMAALLVAGPAQALESRDRAVLLEAQVQKGPPQIRVKWAAQPGATGYTISRKALAETAWRELAKLPGDAAGYSDRDIAAGTAYEYQVVRTASAGSDNVTGYGYLYAGLEAPVIEARGRLVLVVDATCATPLAAELARLEADLRGDGWQVLRHDVARTATPVDVRALIMADRAADPTNTHAVFLLGHVPVPYSGNVNPDGHPDHHGAWPADVYYGVPGDGWTDTAVNNAAASRAENRNIPGDGKWDQSQIPSSVELAVGRVDLANLPAFLPRTEVDLLRQYLDKDHRYRHKLLTAPPRALVADHFGYFRGEAFAASGWRCFSPLCGAARVEAQEWLPTLAGECYLWAYGCGPGGYTGAGGITDTKHWAESQPRAIFTLLFGSYFGDWDVSDSFLRAPLATVDAGLVCGWAGRPGWYLHPMGLGQTVGECSRLTQNNGPDGPYAGGGQAQRGIHISLQGDPTLRLYMVAPPGAVTAETRDRKVSLRWTASPDPVAGYHVYRAPSPNGPFQRLTRDPLTADHFNDRMPERRAYTYKVLALRLESVPSGSFWNTSQAQFCGVTPKPK